jgi:hypothetical protein
MQAMPHLAVPDDPHYWRKLTAGQDTEPAARVIRRIPRHRSEGSQRERINAVGWRLSGGLLQQRAADLAAGGPRMH